MLNILISKDTQKNISQVVGADYSAIKEFLKKIDLKNILKETNYE